MKIKKSFVFFYILLFSIVVATSIHYRSIKDTFVKICKSNAHSIALKCTEDAIYDNIVNIEYSSIITIDKTEDGKIVSITSNVNELNRLSNSIVTSIEENLQKNNTSKIKVPIGAILGSDAFGGYGIDINIKTLPVGDTYIEYLSKFDSVGINQTRHRIILRASSKVEVVAPFKTEIDEYTKEIVLAETIIVGDIPNSYYNISGVSDISAMDATAIGSDE